MGECASANGRMPATLPSMTALGAGNLAPTDMIQLAKRSRDDRFDGPLYATIHTAVIRDKLPQIVTVNTKVEYYTPYGTNFDGFDFGLGSTTYKLKIVSAIDRACRIAFDQLLYDINLGKDGIMQHTLNVLKDVDAVDRVLAPELLVNLEDKRSLPTWLLVSSVFNGSGYKHNVPRTKIVDNVYVAEGATREKWAIDNELKKLKNHLSNLEMACWEAFVREEDESKVAQSDLRGAALRAISDDIYKNEFAARLQAAQEY